MKLADLMQGWAIRRLRPGGRLRFGTGQLGHPSPPGNVTASDCHPLAAQFLQANLPLNHLPDLRFWAGHWQHLDPDLGKFDLIVGGDVLYERNQPEHLAGFIQSHAVAQVDVLIVDPSRGMRSAVRRALERSGFRLKETFLEEPLADGTPYRGRLLHYRRE